MPDYEYFYVDLSSIDHGNVAIPDTKVRFGDLPSRARRVLHHDDVIMSTVRPNLQGFSRCDFDPYDVICSTGFALISPDDKRDSEYIYQNLYGNIITRQLYGLVTGSNYPAVNSSEVRKLRIAFPRIPEERWMISHVLQTAEQQISQFQFSVQQLNLQKKGLMQQLLTGQVRVQVDEE